MSVAFTSIKGITYYNTRKAYQGVTLLTPANGSGSWLIDMMGEFVRYWDTGYKPAYHGELLPNGNLLYAGKVEDGPLADLEGTGGILLETDWEGKVVWRYQDPYLHHAFYRMGNGNTLVLKWVEVPGEIAAKVKGGDPGTEREGIMWGDSIQEITREGEVVWEWIAHEHLDTEKDRTCLLCPRSTWTHANAVVELPDGDILTSFMKNNTIAIIDKKTGDIKWRWGRDDLSHQHSPTALDNGNILVFNNGLHPQNISFGYSQVLEINPDYGKISWFFGGGEEQYLFHSSTMSNCQRLPNGNTFICEGTWGRLFEVTSEGELVWEFVNNLPEYETSPIKSKSCPAHGAYRYGMNYSGLKRPRSLPEEKQRAPGLSLKEGEAVKARLSHLGY